MLIALSTGSLYTHGLDHVFSLAAETGFQGVEIVVDNRWDSHAPTYLRTLQQRHGIPVVCLHAPFFHVDDWPSDATQSLRRTVALAQDLGARTAVVHLPRRFRMGTFFLPGRKPVSFPIPWRSEGAFARWLQEDLPAFQTGTPVTVAVENLPAKRFLGLSIPVWQLNTWDDLVEFPHLNLDTTHVGTWGQDLLAVYERIKDRVAHVHLSNYDGREHRLPMEGRLPLDELLRRLARDAYTGIVSVEVVPLAFASSDEGDVRRQLREAFEFCQQHLQ